MKNTNKINEYKIGDDVFALNGFGEIVLRETCVAILEESYVTVEAYMETIGKLRYAQRSKRATH